MVLDVIPFAKKSNTLNVINLRKLIEKLQIKKGDTLLDYLCDLYTSFNTGDSNYDKCVENIIGEPIQSVNDFKLFMLEQLYLLDVDENTTDEKLTEYKQQVEDFLKININIFDLWYKFIKDKSDGEVVYHTYHGTKGKEFDNVIIFMNSKFGRDKLYFNRLFEVISEKNEDETGKTAEARNLLYVAVTRAVRNLSILYLDDLNGNEIQVSKVFGKIKKKLTNYVE